MRTQIVVSIVIIVLIVYYFSPLLRWTWLPRMTITGSQINNKPLTIYRTTRDRLVSVKKYRNCHQKWIQLNPHINIEWFNDKDCLRYMRTQGKKLLRTYLTLRPGAFKADLFRLCILYERGGMYVDSDALPYVSVREMTRNIEADFISVLDPPRSGEGIHNGLIISSRGHPFLKACIERIVDIVDRLSYEDGCLSITGPICLARAINEYLGRDPNSKFTAGLNEHAGHKLYLFSLRWGPFQYVYKGKQRILSKKHCIFSDLLSRLKSSSYPRMFNRREVYK